MKKFSILFFILFLYGVNGSAQEPIRGQYIGISFFFNDFATPQRIRSTSISRVFSNEQWAKLSEMSPGISVSYSKGLKPHIDFAGTLSGSFTEIPLADKPNIGEGFLLEADATVNLKMFSDRFWFTPYLIAGVGASKFKEYFGAYIPVGGGIRVNLFDEASIFITQQYRIPVTTESNNYHFMTSIGISGIIGNKK